MKCADIMQQKVITCRESDTIATCSKLMRDKNIGFIPIVDASGYVVGTITDRDLVTRGLADGKGFDTKISLLMSRDVIACSKNEDIASCERKMEQEQKSRILVLENDKCVGVISLSDIAQNDRSDRAGEVLRKVTTREAHAASVF